MKKVKHILSSVCDKVAAPRATAVITAALITITSVTCGFCFSSSNRVAAKTNRDSSQKMILELSESYLSPYSITNISVLEASSEINPNEESETVRFEAVLSEGSESEEVTKEVETTETTAPVQETTQEETTEKTVITTENRIPGQSLDGFSFYDLGLSQISEIPVPDSVRFDENGIPLNYRYKISGKSTTYIMGHTTATGTPVHPGVVAVNPNIIPYGTKMYIVANDGSGAVYGYASAEDTGGFIYMDNGPLVDMYVWTMSDVYAWGNRPVDIYIF